MTLKEGRPLLALVRETPLHVGHLRQMLAFAEMGGIVFPPVPAFYQKPADRRRHRRSHTVARVLERMGLADEPARVERRWPQDAQRATAPGHLGAHGPSAASTSSKAE